MNTAQEILKIMREHPNRHLVFVTRSFTAWGNDVVPAIGITAGDIYVTDGLNHDDVPKSVFDQLLADGLIEKESEDTDLIRYKLSETKE